MAEKIIHENLVALLEDVLAVLLGVGIVALSLSTLAGLEFAWLVGGRQRMGRFGKARTFLIRLRADYRVRGSRFDVSVSLGSPCRRCRFSSSTSGLFQHPFRSLVHPGVQRWVAGHNSYIAATPNKRPPGVEWSLGLTGEAGFLLALIGGLLIGNLFRALPHGSKNRPGPNCSSRQEL